MENKKIVHGIVIGSCFGLVAVGAGIAFRGDTSSDKYTPVEPDIPLKAEIPPIDYESSYLEIERVNISNTEKLNDTNVDIERGEVSENLAETSNAVVETAKVEATTEVEEVETTEEETALVFAYPTEGEIILPYSVESAIYDPTLDQYRTNDSMSFASREGDPVLVAEKGVVKEIINDEERGNSLVVEHNDGWLTTYSQLAGEMLVAVGEDVYKGQAVAFVAQPTKYTLALGEHLEFAIEKDGEMKDPKEVVED